MAHGNGDMSGDFVWTLRVADELTGGMQNRTIWNKEHYETREVTRMHPNRKNDNARVEERHLHVVRE